MIKALWGCRCPQQWPLFQDHLTRLGKVMRNHLISAQLHDIARTSTSKTGCNENMCLAWEVDVVAESLGLFPLSSPLKIQKGGPSCAIYALDIFRFQVIFRAFLGTQHLQHFFAPGAAPFPTPTAACGAARDGIAAATLGGQFDGAGAEARHPFAGWVMGENGCWASIDDISWPIESKGGDGLVAPWQELEGQMAQAQAQMQGMMNAVSAGALNPGNGGGGSERLQKYGLRLPWSNPKKFSELTQSSPKKTDQTHPNFPNSNPNCPVFGTHVGQTRHRGSHHGRCRSGGFGLGQLGGPAVGLGTWGPSEGGLGGWDRGAAEAEAGLIGVEAMDFLIKDGWLNWQ